MLETAVPVIFIAIAVYLGMGAPGCAATLPGSVMQPSDTAEVVAAWQAAGEPYSAASCVAPRIVIASGAEFEQLCMASACSMPQVPPCDDSCFAYRVPAVVVAPQFAQRGWINHELLHWLQWCNGMAMDHADTRIWSRPDGLLAKVGG